MNGLQEPQKQETGMATTLTPNAYLLGTLILVPFFFLFVMSNPLGYRSPDDPVFCIDHFLLALFK